MVFEGKLLLNLVFALKNILISICFQILKTIVLRDSWICLVMSFLFEVLEYSLQHQLSNFSECWWDHVIYLIFLKQTRNSFSKLFNLIVDTRFFILQWSRHLLGHENVRVLFYEAIYLARR